jgi:hypothetical protein
MTKLQQLSLSADDVRAMNEVVPRLQRLLDVAEAVVVDAVEQPAPESKKGQADESRLHDAYDYVGALIFAGEDHLRLIRSVLETGPLPSFALYPLLRAAAEAMVRARHLLDLDITETQRLARGLNERLDNLDEQKKIAPDALDDGHDELFAHYEERVAHLEERAVENGIKVCRQRLKDGSAGKITGFDEPIRSDFSLFSTYLYEGPTAYRWLSGHVHSKPWVQLPKSAATPSADPEVALVQTGMNIPLFANLLDCVLDVYEESLVAWLVLAGYPRDTLKIALGTASTTSP